MFIKEWMKHDSITLSQESQTHLQGQWNSFPSAWSLTTQLTSKIAEYKKRGEICTIFLHDKNILLW